MYEMHHLREYWAIRTSAGLLDISPLYKYHIRGSQALKFLNRLVTRDVARCAVGQVMYTPWCDEQGQIIEDGTLARLDAIDVRIRPVAEDAVGQLGHLRGDVGVIVQADDDRNRFTDRCTHPSQELTLGVFEIFGDCGAVQVEIDRVHRQLLREHADHLGRDALERVARHVTARPAARPDQRHVVVRAPHRL